MEHAEHLHSTFVSSALCSSLIDGVKWLKKALEVIPVASNHKRCKLSDVEEVLSELQVINLCCLSSQTFTMFFKNILSNMCIYIFIMIYIYIFPLDLLWTTFDVFKLQRIEASFPLMADQLLNAIEKHRCVFNCGILRIFLGVELNKLDMDYKICFDRCYDYGG